MAEVKGRPDSFPDPSEDRHIIDYWVTADSSGVIRIPNDPIGSLHRHREQIRKKIAEAAQRIFVDRKPTGLRHQIRLLTEETEQERPYHKYGIRPWGGTPANGPASRSQVFRRVRQGKTKTEEQAYADAAIDRQSERVVEGPNGKSLVEYDLQVRLGSRTMTHPSRTVWYRISTLLLLLGGRRGGKVVYSRGDWPMAFIGSESAPQMSIISGRAYEPGKNSGRTYGAYFGKQRRKNMSFTQFAYKVTMGSMDPHPEVAEAVFSKEPRAEFKREVRRIIEEQTKQGLGRTYRFPYEIDSRAFEATGQATLTATEARRRAKAEAEARKREAAEREAKERRRQFTQQVGAGQATFIERDLVGNRYNPPRRGANREVVRQYIMRQIDAAYRAKTSEFQRLRNALVAATDRAKKGLTKEDRAEAAALAKQIQDQINARSKRLMDFLNAVSTVSDEHRAAADAIRRQLGGG